MPTTLPQVLSEPSASERQKHLKHLQNLVKENKGLGTTLQKQLKEEKGVVEKLAKRQEAGSEVEIRRTQTSACSRRFLDIWTDYNNIQIEFRENNKKALLRTIRVVDPQSTITEEEIEEKLEAGDLTVLASIIKESEQAKEDLKKLEDRHLEMVRLEKGICEVSWTHSALPYSLPPAGARHVHGALPHGGGPGGGGGQDRGQGGPGRHRRGGGQAAAQERREEEEISEKTEVYPGRDRRWGGRSGHPDPLLPALIAPKPYLPQEPSSLFLLI